MVELTLFLATPGGNLGTTHVPKRRFHIVDGGNPVPLRAQHYGNSTEEWTYSHLSVDRLWLWVYVNEIPIYPIFYLPKGDYRVVQDFYSIGS